jgi:hypothetical protein
MHASRVRRYAAGIANLALAGMFLWCWLQPHALKRALAADLTVLLLLEIIALGVTNHFIDRFDRQQELDEAGRRREELKQAAELPISAIAMLGIVAYTGTWLSAAFILWTVAPRGWLISELRSEPEAAVKEQMALWKLSWLGMLLLAFIAKGLPMPKFGMTLPAAEYGMAGWPSVVQGHPQDLIALGLGYFTLTGLLMLLSRPPDAQRR